MKDEDIILACELCLNAGERCPYNCPYYEYSGLSCQYALSEDAFDLINRQQAEIDRLQETIENRKEADRIALEAYEQLLYENDYQQAEIERLKTELNDCEIKK